MDDLKIIESGGFGISKVHEIFVLKEDNQILYWKKVNWVKDVEKIQSKRPNKDDVLQEDLDNDSECTTDDETEESARRSASSILYFSAIVKT